MTHLADCRTRLFSIAPMYRDSQRHVPFRASQFRVPQKMHNLTVWVVDFDGQEETRHDVREDPFRQLQ